MNPAVTLLPLLLGPALTLAVPPSAARAAEDVGVGVELVLAVDVSRSMDMTEQRVQRQGYAAAFRSDEVLGAILNGGWGRVAVAYVEWAGTQTQSVMIPWTLIDSADSAEAFARAVETGRMGTYSRTSISGALEFSTALFEDNGYAGLRQVIDVSGDGPNNQGRAVTEARDAAIARRITINGLPLMTNVGDPDNGFGGWSTIADLDVYFEDCVIGGPGAFAIPVVSWDQFAAAVRQKLVLELAGDMPGAEGPERLIRVQAAASSRVDCLIGETLWQRRQQMWE
ncbi:DUF1194 domain-containing protein [Frigidibacter oleivorans]|uniref:DUF1194 domain-containing protein n=1 Tax=Frigidibacter oleivorans TaxID=2487129 RepID=UPI000F8D5950|nr:DUF1194 domain-containing protein [Frigidibacter oleivorans]